MQLSFFRDCNFITLRNEVESALPTGLCGGVFLKKNDKIILGPFEERISSTSKSPDKEKFL